MPFNILGFLIATTFMALSLIIIAIGLAKVEFGKKIAYISIGLFLWFISLPTAFAMQA